MNSNFEYRKFAIMYVDDEAQTISNFKAYFSDTFDVVVASSGEEAWQLFSANQDRFAVVMTDQRMPSSSGVELLEKVRAARPRVIRILATAYSDLDAAIAAVNEGAIYKYVPKPWDPPILEMLLKRAMEFFLVQRELDSLMREKMAAMQRLMMTDRLLSLGIFAAGLNHHIRNSLTAIKTFLDLAPFQLQQENVNIEQLRNPNYWRDFYETVQSQMGKIVTLLGDINEIPEPAGVSLGDTVVVDDVIVNASETNRGAFIAKGIKLDFVSGKVPAICGNRALLDKGLNLLLADELANVPEGGKITVKTSLAKDATGEDGIKIEVVDNGPGLSADNVNCIFDPFFVRRDNPAEYGLNLLTCFFIVYHHSGSMSVSQSAEGGAHFEIFLPFQPNRQNPKQAQAYLDRIFELEKAWEKMLVGY